MTVRSYRVFLGDSRDMSVLEDGSVQLVVTSPPYWSIKDYGHTGQLGHGQSLHDYLRGLYRVWKECERVLSPGRKVCINIGDQFARASDFGKYRVIPLHVEIISQMERLGFDFMGDIIWEKRTTMNTSGGAPVMGSYPYPPNGIIEIDYEHIMVFKKPGEVLGVTKDMKEASVISRDDWKELFRSHWRFGGARQIGHEAMFPLELPARLIRMFSLKDETVLDPFLGSGTTLQAAFELGRSGVGFEINQESIPMVKDRFGPLFSSELVFTETGSSSKAADIDDYVPSIKDMSPPRPKKVGAGAGRTLLRVDGVDRDLNLILSDGSKRSLAGLRTFDTIGALTYLDERVKGKHVSIDGTDPNGRCIVHLKNRIFVNGELIRSGYAVPDPDYMGPSAARLKRIAAKTIKGS
ncbi:MAG: site-specific DNA-methyltransferase [Candidatus Thermoplasmatota archaeon]|jgi:DNA modification methylase|nr:site-specific DNA-methyltransferase [Candidatus Thermoplasmatota archaeon]